MKSALRQIAFKLTALLALGVATPLLGQAQTTSTPARPQTSSSATLPMLGRPQSSTAQSTAPSALPGAAPYTAPLSVQGATLPPSTQVPRIGPTTDVDPSRIRVERMTPEQLRDFQRLMQKGGIDGGGGVDYGIEISNALISAMKGLQQEKPDDYRTIELRGVEYAMLIAEMKIILVDTPLFVETASGRQECVMISYKDAKTVVVNTARWAAIDNPYIKEGLILHEFLVLLGVESTGYYGITLSFMIDKGISVGSLTIGQQVDLSPAQQQQRFTNQCTYGIEQMMRYQTEWIRAVSTCFNDRNPGIAGKLEPAVLSAARLCVSTCPHAAEGYGDFVANCNSVITDVGRIKVASPARCTN